MLLAIVLLSCTVSAFADTYTVNINFYNSDRTTLLTQNDVSTMGLCAYVEVKDTASGNTTGWDLNCFDPHSTSLPVTWSISNFKTTSQGPYEGGSIAFNSGSHSISSVRLFAANQWNMSYNGVQTNPPSEVIEGFKVEKPAEPGSTSTDINLYSNAYSVAVEFYDYDKTTLKQYNGDNNELYIYLDIRDKSTGQIVGWNVQQINPKQKSSGNNNACSYNDDGSIVTCPFVKFGNILTENNKKNLNLNDNPINFDPDQYEIARARLYSTSPNYHTVREDLGSGESRPNDTVDGCKFITSTVGETKTTMKLQKWNGSHLYIDVNIDPATSQAITTGDGYWLRAKLTHTTGTPTYFAAPLAIAAGETHLRVEANEWREGQNFGILPHEKFTGNEPDVEVQIIKARTGQNPTAAEVAKLDASKVEVIGNGSMVKDYKVDYVDGVLTIAERKVDNNSVYETVCVYNIYLIKESLENALTPEDILGEAVEFGIVANRYDQFGHTETNFAVNHFFDNGSNIDIDGSGSTPIPFYVGDVTDTAEDGTSVTDPKLWLSSGTTVPADIFMTPEDIAAEKYNIKSTHPTNIYPMAQTEINAYVNGLIQAGKETSLALASKTTLKPIFDGSNFTVDTTGFPDGTTIYVDADGILNSIGAGGWHINKLPNQSIVFNIKAQSNTTVNDAVDGTVPAIKIGEFTVNPNDGGSEVNSTTSAMNGNQALNQRVDDVIFSHIFFNVVNATHVHLDNASALFLLPEATRVTQSNGAGWILAKGTVDSHAEWHFYRHTRSYKAKGDFVLGSRKNLVDGYNNNIPYENKNFKFEIYNSDETGTILSTLIETSLANGTTGLINFQSIKYTDAEVPMNETRTFYYLIKEVIPDNAVNANGVQYKDATAEQKASDIFTKDGILYNAEPILVKITATNTPDAADPTKGVITVAVEVDGTPVTGTAEEHPVFKLQDIQKVFTNTKLISISAKKAWRNADNSPLTLPAGTTITYRLYRKIGNADPIPTEHMVALNGETDPVPEGTGVLGYESAPWTVTFSQLPGVDSDTSSPTYGSAITYLVGEETPAGFTASPASPVEDGKTIINTADKVEISAQKAWVNADGSTTPPAGASVVFMLYANGTPADITVTLDGTPGTAPTGAGGYESAAWTAKFVNLPPYDDQGNAITYTVRETTPYQNYNIVPESGVPNGGTITNTKGEIVVTGRISLSATKEMDPWPYRKSFTFNLAGSGDAAGKLTGVTTSGTASETARTVTFGPINFTADDDGKTFTFTITETYPGSDNGNVYQGVTYDRTEHTVTVVPHVNGTSMTFEVTDDEGITTTNNLSGTTVAAASLSNSYDVSGRETLKITKALTAGQSWPNGDTVEFTLTPKTSGAPMPTAANGNKVTLSAIGEGSFGEITFDASDAGKTYQYEITETRGFGGGWSNNGPVTATITVGQDTGNGTLATSVTYTNSGTITNNEAQDGSIAFSVTKAIKDDGIWPKGKSFTIVLAADPDSTNASEKLAGLSQSDLSQTVTSEDRNAAFPAIRFSGEDVDKEFKFTISEVNKGTTANGITYSNTTYNITVTLQNESGRVTPHVSVNNTDMTASISGGVLTLDPIVNDYNASGTFTAQAQKEIEDHDGDKTEERTFTFELRYKGAAASSTALRTQTFSLKDGNTVDVIFEEPITYSLDTLAQLVGENRARKIDGNTWEIDYTLTEKDSTDKAMKSNNQTFDFTVTVVDNGNGTLSCTPSLTKTQMKFVNVELNDASLTLAGKKELPERELTNSDKWTFTISSPNGGPLPDPASVTNTLADFSFNPIRFTPQHLGNNQEPATYRYEVRESGSVANVTNTTGVKEFTVTVKVVDGVLQAVSDPEDLTALLTFTNHYYEAGSVVLGARKSMENNIWPTGTTQFKFSITGDNDAAREILSAQEIDSEATATQANPTAKFEALTFTQDDLAKSPFVFIIKEKELDGTVDHVLDGVTYSTDEYRVEITLLTGPGGRIVPIVTANGKPVGEENSIFTIGEFTNKYETSSCTFKLEATKNVQDADSSPEERTFTFDLHYGSATAASIASKQVTLRDGETADIAFDDIVFTREILDDLVNSQYASRSTVNGKLTWTINYVLTEQPSTSTDKAMHENTTAFNVVVTVVDDGYGHLSCSYTPQKASLTFVNQERKDVKLTVSGGKRLTGRSLTESDQWTFTIEALDGGPLPAQTSVQNTMGTFTFGDIIFTPQHLANNEEDITYHYKVTESGSVPAVSNFEGSKEFSVTLSIDDTTDELKAVSDPTNLGTLLTFENHYHDEGTLVLAATKSMTANNWPTGTPSFTFKLVGTDDESKAKIGQNGLTATADRNNTTARFPQIIFTEADEAISKVYHFTVSEVIPEDAEDYISKGVTYSNLSYPVTVTLTNDGLGKITPVVTVNESNIPLNNNIFTVGDFRNTYNAEKCTFTLEATKKINDADGETDENRIFFFDLRYKSAEPTSAPLASKEISIRDGETKDVIFDGIEYTIESLTAMVNDNRATVSTVNGKRTWTINYIVSERTVTDKAIKPNTQSFEVTVTVTDDGEGHLNCTSSPSKSERRFVNDERKDTSINVSGGKKLTGRALTESDKWTFTISSSDGGPMPAERSVENTTGTFTFGNIVFTPQHLGANATSKTYHYTVTETGTVASVTNDSAKNFTVTLSVDPSTNELKAVTDPTNLGTLLTFTNQYHDEGSLPIAVQKTMNIWPTGTTSFSFKLEGTDEVSKAKIGENGITATATSSSPTAIFPAISFNETDEAISTTYQFTITEIVPEDAVNNVLNGVTYVSQPITVDVELTNDGAGHITPIVRAGNRYIPLTNNVFTVGTFANTYTAASTSFVLEATKEIDDADGKSDIERSFTFELRYKSADQTAEPLATETIKMYDGQTADIIFDGITYTRDTLAALVADDKATYGTVNGLTTWTIPYTLKEKATEVKAMKPNSQVFDVTVTVTDDGKGKLTCSATPTKATLAFVNAERDDVKIRISGGKVLTGRALTENDKWTFSIASSDGGPLPAQTQVQNTTGTFTFGDIVFTPQHLGDNATAKTYHYTVTESGTIAAVENDSSTKSFTITVSVDPADNELDVVSDPTNLGELLRFTNHYHEEGELVLTARKNMNIWPTGTSSFTFKLEGTDAVSKAKIGENGITATATQNNPTAGFPAIRFTEEDEAVSKVYNFVVTEVVPQGARNNVLNGVTYSAESYPVKVTLTNDGAGKIEPIVEVNGTNIPRDNNVFNVGTFTNTYAAAETTFVLEATKEIDDEDGNTREERSFTFELRYKSADQDAVPFAAKTVTLHDGDTVDVKFDGITYTRESLMALVNDNKATYTTVNGLTTWTIPYTLKEKASTDKAMKPNYQSFDITVTVTDDGKGALSCSATPAKASLAFVNSERNDARTSISGGKVLTGRALTASDKWTFTIATSDNGPLPSRTSVQNTLGTFTFGDIVFTPQHLGDNGTAKTYHYTVTESGSVTAVANDSTSKAFTITVSVDPSDNELDVVTDPTNLGELLTFTNHYQDEGELVLTARKNMNIWPTGTTSFTFKLEGTDDVSKAKIGEAGLTTDATQNNPTAGFPAIRFTEADEAISKVYNFVVTEVVPEGAVNNVFNGVTYSTESYPVQVTLTNDGAGKIEPIVRVNGTNIPRTNLVFQVGTFTNTYETSSCTFTLEGSKQVNDADSNTGERRNFTFELRYKSAEPGTAPLYTSNLTINDGQTADFIFEGITYTRDFLATLVRENKATRGTVEGKTTWTIPYVLTEKAVTVNGLKPNSQSFNVTVTVTDDGKGALSCTASPEKASLAFVNNERANTSINISGSKVLIGRKLTNDDKWSFTIEAITDGAPLPTPATVQNEGSVINFGTINFVPENLGDNATQKTYVYKVTETGAVTSVTNDDTPRIFTVTVSVDPSTGNLKAVSNPSELGGLLTFTNRYHDEGSLVLAASKVINTWPTGTSSFIFKLTGDDKPSRDKIGADGLTAEATSNNRKVIFPPIYFTEEDEAISTVYNFTVTEVVPRDKKGVTYSGDSFKVKVTLLSDGSGHITPQVESNGKLIPIENNTFTVGSFINSYNAEDTTFKLKAMKEVKNNDQKKEERNFTFELRYKSADPASEPFATVDLRIKDGETKTFSFEDIRYSIDSLNALVDEYKATVSTVEGKTTWRIPYILTEKAANVNGLKSNSQHFEVIVLVTDDGEGHLTCTSTPDETVLKFVNEERANAVVKVSGGKKLTGRTLTDRDRWTFTIEALDGGPLPARRTTTNSLGTFTFDDIVFEPESLGDNAAARTYQYRVTETGNVNSVTNDEASKTFSVNVSVDPSTGNLRAVSVPSDLGELLTFTNHYHDEGTLALGVRKSMTYWPSGTASITFKLTGDDEVSKAKVGGENGMTAVATKNAPTAIFNEIKFTEEDEAISKTYRFTVKEVIPAEARNNVLNGVTYSPKEIHLVVTLTNDGQGKIIPIVEADGKNIEFKNNIFTIGEFTNSYNAVECTFTLTALKHVEDVDGNLDEKRDFTFELRYKARRNQDPALMTTELRQIPDGETREFSFEGITYTIDFLNSLVADNLATVSEADGKTTWRIPYVLKERVTSINGMKPNSEEYEVIVYVTDDGKGQLTCTAEPTKNELLFTNNERANTSVLVSGGKKLTGRQLKEGDQWTFTIEALDGGPLPAQTVVTNTIGTFTFGHIIFVPETLGEGATSKTYTYKVTESGSITSVDNDETAEKTFTVTVSVDPSSGNLRAVSDPVDLGELLTFTNHYHDKGSLVLAAKKEINVWPSGTDSFTFRLRGEDEVSRAKLGSADGITVTVDKEHLTAVFSKINFDETDEEKSTVYKFVITEDIPSNAINNRLNNVVYTTNEIHVVVTLTNDGLGNIIPIVEADGQRVEQNGGNYIVGTLANTYEAVGKLLLKSSKHIVDADQDKSESHQIPFELWYKEDHEKFLNGDEDVQPFIVNDVTIYDDGTTPFEYPIKYTLAELPDPADPENPQQGEDGYVDEDGFKIASLPKLKRIGKASSVITSDPQTETWTIDYILDEKTVVDQQLKPPDQTFEIIVTLVDDGEGNLNVTRIAETNVNKPEEGTRVIDVTDPEAGIDVGEFENRERVDAEPISVSGGKTIEGRSLTDSDNGKWTVVLTVEPENGPLPAQSEVAISVAGGIGSYTFGPIQFSAVHLGECRESAAEKYTCDPKDYTYTITETGVVDGVTNDSVKTFKVRASLDENGNVKAEIIDPANPADLQNRLTFTNRYAADGDAEIKVQKVLEGREWLTTDVFEFTITAENGAPMPERSRITITSDTADAVESFGTIHFTEPGTYQYKVTEVQGDIERISYDTLVHLVTITVIDDGQGNLIAVDGTNLIQTVTITNTYTSAMVEFYGHKTLTGKDLENAEFTFVLLDGDGNVLQTVTNNGSQITFEPITYTEPGTYTYIVRELAGNEEGITYDTREYNITVKVTRDGNGNLVVETSGDDPHALDFTNEHQTVFHRITPTAPTMPETGFSAIHPQALPEKPKDIVYKPLRWTLQIPTLDVITDIVEVPSEDGNYPVTWLGASAGLLEGYALPGSGTSIITGHNHLNTTEAGPFAFLQKLQEGDRIFVLDPDNEMQIFAVYANEKIDETDFAGLYRIAGAHDRSLTMITCEDERPTGGYQNRRIIAAAPIH